MMWPVETLNDLQKKVMRNMRLSERTPILRMTYRFLVVLPDKSCRYRTRGLPRLVLVTSNPAPDIEAPTTADLVDVVPPHEHIGETESEGEDAGESEGGNSGAGNDEFVSATPISTRFLLPTPIPVPDLSTVDSHFHTLDLDVIEEDWLTDIGGGSDDYNLDGGVELRVGHRFCSREAVHMGVKNYSIRRAAEYKVLESDSMKYHCVCKQSANWCPWRIRISYRVNL
ncbi:hypothetical protein PIB30_062110 [Stylosanthes scabra]|uniref:Transposase MuDR plant domain-containing protein n=1 Tax=Stylosanthes scabra TaxID=79078 RepID=A0ABU6TKV9_9FABA|nr:hypothetical protein [Stylosanthes scabra]